MSEYQYHVIIENGEEKTKTGYFYPASPFEVHFDNRKVSVNFKQNPKQTAVIYELSEKGNVLNRLTHPDYVPEISLGNYVSIEDLPKTDLSLYAALTFLGVSKEGNYKDYFLKENQSEFSFEIIQTQP